MTKFEQLLLTNSVSLMGPVTSQIDRNFSVLTSSHSVTLQLCADGLWQSLNISCTISSSSSSSINTSVLVEVLIGSVAAFVLLMFGVAYTRKQMVCFVLCISIGQFFVFGCLAMISHNKHNNNTTAETAHF